MLGRRGSYRAVSNPRSRNQTPYGGSGDQQVDAYSRRIARELSRDLDRNADTFRVVMNAWRSAIYGKAVQWRPTTGNPEWNHKASKLLHERMKRRKDGVDVRCIRTGYRLLGDYVRAAGVDGEAAMIKLDNGQAQAIESEQITNGGRHMARSLDGVKYNDAGQITLFHIVPYSSVGALNFGGGTDYSEADILWTPLRSRFSQTRGMPPLIAALDSWERLDSYMESEVIAAEQGSQIYGAIERVPGDMGFGSAFTPQDTSVDPSGIMRGGTNNSGSLDWQGTAAGSLMELPNGAKYVGVNPNRPNKDAAPFLIEMLRLFCNNLGLPYEFVFNDLRGMSWSVNRALVAMARDRIGNMQEDDFGPAFTEFYQWQLAHLIDIGELDEIDGWEQGELSWPVISWPDEGKEYEAQSLGLREGLTSRHRTIGPGWRTLMTERLDELNFASELSKQHNKTHPEFPVEPRFFLGTEQGNANQASVEGGDSVKLPGANGTIQPAQDKMDEKDEKDINAAQDVQGEAMNGAQVASMVEVISAVSDGKLPKEAASIILQSAFPTLKQESIKKAVDAAGAFMPRVAPTETV